MTDLDLLLSALLHPTRRAALRLLRQEGELCLCELMASINVGQSTMSRHMTMLKDAGLVVDRRDAQWVRYRLVPIADEGVERIASAVMDMAEQSAVAQKVRNAA